MRNSPTSRGLRPNKGRPHKYLADPTATASEAPDDYIVEDGVLIDSAERPEAFKAYDKFTRYWRPSKEDRAKEEARWASLSGPCTIIQKGHTA